MDFSLIDKIVNNIRAAPIENLLEENFISEMVKEIGCLDGCGDQWNIRQCSKQFSKYLRFISSLDIRSYLEIGVWRAGSFIFTVEYLNRFNLIEKCCAVDILDLNHIFDFYKKYNDKCIFIHTDNRDINFKNSIYKEKFDLVLVDGDHSYESVINDFGIASKVGKFISMHDIKDSTWVDVSKFWTELELEEDKFSKISEFTEEGQAGLGVLYNKLLLSENFNNIIIYQNIKRG